jgi:hypothetical protein
MINLDLTSEDNREVFNDIKNGVWAIDADTDIDSDSDADIIKGRRLVDLKVASSLSININTEGLKKCKTLFVSGALTDNFINHIRQNKIFNETEIVVRDFTKIFLTPMTYNSFVNVRRKITVLQKSKLIAVCVNPTSPNGIVLDSEKLCKTLSEAIKLPVYDLKKNF